jgi:hypothetical protein
MYVYHIYIVHRLTNVLRGWEISYYARNRGAKIKRQHGTYHPASGPPSFFFLSSWRLWILCHLPLSPFPAILTTRRDSIRELCIRADRSKHFFDPFFPPPFTTVVLHCVPFCVICLRYHIQISMPTYKRATFYYIYRSLWAEYLTFFPYQVLSPKNVLLSSTFDFAICTMASHALGNQ